MRIRNNVCCNIYGCNEAAKFERAEAYWTLECGVCGGDDAVNVNEVNEMILACPVCSAINGAGNISDAFLEECMYESGAYCCYCGIEYPTDEQDKETYKLIAEFLKVFIGQRSEELMRKELYELVRANSCSRICSLIHNILEVRMEEGPKSKLLKDKIKAVVLPMRLLKKECKGDLNTVLFK